MSTPGMEITLNFGQNVSPAGVGVADPPKATYKVKFLGVRQHKSKKGAVGLMAKFQITEPGTVGDKATNGWTWEVWTSLPDGKNAEQDGYRVAEIKAMIIAFAGEANRAKIAAMNGQSAFNFAQLVGRVGHMKWEPAVDDDGYSAITYISDVQYAEVVAGTLQLPDRAKAGKPKAGGAGAAGAGFQSTGQAGGLDLGGAPAAGNNGVAAAAAGGSAGGVLDLM